MSPWASPIQYSCTCVPCDQYYNPMMQQKIMPKIIRIDFLWLIIKAGRNTSIKIDHRKPNRKIYITQF